MFVKTIANNVPSVVQDVVTGRQKGDRKSLLVEDDDDDYDAFDEYNDEHGDNGDLTSMEGSSHHTNKSGLIRQTSLSQPSQHSYDGSDQLSSGSSIHRRGGHRVGGVKLGSSKAVMGGVVGGSKAVVGGGIKGGKAVAGGVGRGSKAVVGGVVGGSKAVVEGVDGVLNRSAKKFEDTLNRSANKVVGGVVGVGSSVVGGIGSSLLFRNSIKEDKEQQDEHENTDFSESRHSDRGSENGGSTRSLKVMKYGSSNSRGLEAKTRSCRNSLGSGLNNTSRRVASGFGVVPGDFTGNEQGKNSPRRTNTAKSTTTTVKTDMGYGEAAAAAPSPPKGLTKARRRGSAFGATMDDEAKTEATIKAMSGGEIISARARAGSTASLNSSASEKGYGETVPPSPNKTAGKKTARRRASALGAVPGGYVTSEEMPVSIDTVHVDKKHGAQLVFGVDPASEEDDTVPPPPPPPPKATKKANRRRASTAEAVMDANCAPSDDKPAVSKTVTAAQDMATESPSKARKKKVSRRRSSALGATPDGYTSSDDAFMPKKPIAPADEEMGYASCDGGVSPRKITKKRAGRRPATSAVPSGHVAELIAKMSGSGNNTTPLIAPKAKKVTGKENDVKEEQPGKEDEAVTTTTAPTPKQKKTKTKEQPEKAEPQGKKDEAVTTTETPTPKQKTTKAKDQPEKADEAAPSTTSATTGNAKVKKSCKVKTKAHEDGDGDGETAAASNLEAPKPKKSSKKVATADAAEVAGSPTNLSKPKLNKDKTKTPKSRKFKLSKEEVESLRDLGGKKVIKIKVKRKGKTAGACGDGDKSVNGGLVGAMNPMNVFKKSGTDGSSNPTKTSKMGAAMGGMFKRRPSMGREMSSRSLQSVSGRSDDDKSVRSMKSTRSKKSVFGKAKTWLMKPRGIVGTATGKDGDAGDTCGGMVDEDLSNGNMSAELQRIRNIGEPSETTAEASEGPPMEIFANKCSKCKKDTLPVGRGAIIQKQWLAGGTNFDNKTRRKISICDDDSDDDTSHHAKEDDENEDAADDDDDISEISFIDPPLTRLPMPTNPSQPSEVEYWKRVCDERNKRYGTKHRLTTDAYLCKGNAELSSQDYKAATKSLLKGVSYLHVLYGDSHPRVARGLHLLGAAACFHGELPLAEESTLNAFEMRRNTLGVCHVDTIDTFANLGMIYHKMENYPEARRIFSELVQLRKAIYGQPHHSIAFANRSLAQVFVSAGDKDKARKYYVKALRTFDKLRMTRALDETEADMTKYDIEIPLKAKDEAAASVPANPDEPPEELRMCYI